MTGSGITEGSGGNSGDSDLFRVARKGRPRRGKGVPLLAGGLEWERCCLRLASFIGLGMKLPNGGSGFRVAGGKPVGGPKELFLVV